MLCVRVRSRGGSARHSNTVVSVIPLNLMRMHASAIPLEDALVDMFSKERCRGERQFAVVWKSRRVQRATRDFAVFARIDIVGDWLEPDDNICLFVRRDNLDMHMS